MTLAEKTALSGSPATTVARTVGYPCHKRGCIACVRAHTRTAGDFRKASRVSRVRETTNLTNYNLCAIVLVLSLQIANERGKYEPKSPTDFNGHYGC